MDKLIMVIGPTGVGKSNVGVKVAQKLGSEVVSGDSIQIYRKLDIGSAKITKEEMGGVPHHMIDILNVDEPFSVYDYQVKGRECIQSIVDRGKIPVVVGGTGLYTKAMVYDYSFDLNENSKEENSERKNKTNEELYQELVEVDPEAAEKIHPNNRKRVLRALTIADQGITKSELEKAQEHKPIYDIFWIECTRDKAELNQRVHDRIQEMVKEGLKEEIEGLMKEYPDLWTYQSMQGIGYKEWKAYYEGTQSLEETLHLIEKNTKQFIKRQMTWIRHQFPQNWYNLSESNEMGRMEKELEEWLKK